MKLDNFINMMTGHFDNKEQFDMMQEAGKSYPYAEHVNTFYRKKNVHFFLFFACPVWAGGNRPQP